MTISQSLLKGLPAGIFHFLSVDSLIEPLKSLVNYASNSCSGPGSDSVVASGFEDLEIEPEIDRDARAEVGDELTNEQHENSKHSLSTIKGEFVEEALKQSEKYLPYDNVTDKVHLRSPKLCFLPNVAPPSSAWSYHFESMALYFLTSELVNLNVRFRGRVNLPLGLAP